MNKLDDQWKHNHCIPKMEAGGFCVSDILGVTSFEQSGRLFGLTFAREQSLSVDDDPIDTCRASGKCDVRSERKKKRQKRQLAPTGRKRGMNQL